MHDLSLLFTEAATKRHERYCLKTLSDPPPSRRKSCLACIRAKSRCSGGVPQCEQCQRKGKPCAYATETKPTRVSQEESVSASRNQVARLDIPICDGIDHQPSDIWKRLPRRSDFEDPSKFATSFHPRLPVDGSTHSKEDNLVAETHLDVDLEKHYLDVLLRRKADHSSNTGLIQSLVLQMLCAFPDKRMTEDSHPSFIHYSVFSHLTNMLNFEDPLVICRSIARRYASRKDAEYSSIWDDIVTEQARIYDNRVTFDKWLTLSGAQAITVYLLMLAAEGETVLKSYPNLPVALLFTLGTLFGELNKMIDGFEATKDMFGNGPVWEDWIFAESKLRTAMTYFMMAQQFELYFGLPCNRADDYTFEEINLPASKALWEAKDFNSWHEEYRLSEANDQEVRLKSGILWQLKYTDLIESNHQQSQRGSSQGLKAVVEERIKEWQKRVDDFGILVALCSTLG